MDIVDQLNRTDGINFDEQKKLVKKKKKEHLRVFIKDVAQLLGLSKTAA